MSVARARDLIERLASDPDLASQIEKASTRQAKRDIINREGFGDVSGEDVLQAVGDAVVQNIARGQGSADAELERVYLLAAESSDGAGPGR